MADSGQAQRNLGRANETQDTYEIVLKRIDEKETMPFDVLARNVVGEVHRIGKPLNLMNDSVLHVVIASRKINLAVAIIGLPDDINRNILCHRNYFGDTPLHIAAEIGNSKVAKALVARDGSLAHKKNKKGETPLHKAVQFGHLDVFEIIIGVGGHEMASLRTGDGFTILHYAIMRNQPKEALDIAEKFPELIWTRNADGASPLQMMMVYYWWPRLPGKVKVRDEKSNYGTSMELLKLLVKLEDFEFYIKGFTSDRSIKSHTPIHSVVLKNSVALLAEEDTDRLDKEPEVKNRIRWDESPLTSGVKLGLDDFVIEILKVRPELATYLNYDGTNVLQVAVKYGRGRVVMAIKKDNWLPRWLLTDLEPDTDNTLLHIAASNKISSNEANPLRLRNELEWFEMLEKIVPKYLWDYRNRRRMTAREVFDETHEGTLKDCREKLKQNSQNISLRLTTVLFTSSFFILRTNNQERNRMAFKISSRVYVVGFFCAAASLVLFRLLVAWRFKQQDFRRKVPLCYLMAQFLMSICLIAFVVAYACIVYLHVYTESGDAIAPAPLRPLPRGRIPPR
ncbi:hypothetical protein ZIOFF_076235 [Zingiber officinale]|uniref:Uncharacterized protein n=1 Tax=Zingiber officinale TaxID=94328 RepID=A0A8J5BZG8_ZINOF|nr:hypothetical protein ZIOFF_076235 [Zingiber officinale]